MSESSISNSVKRKLDDIVDQPNKKSNNIKYFVKELFEGDKINGKGILTTNYYVYEGEIYNKLPHGKGKITYLNKNYSEGIFTDGKLTLLDGKFRKVLCNGYYEGTYVKGKMEGSIIGEITNYDTIYKGEFILDKSILVCTGKGRITCKNGSFWEGNFINGYLQNVGNGRLFFSNYIYEGEVRSINNIISQTGKGKIKFVDGYYVEGNFINGILHNIGKGKISSNDSVYEGDLKYENNKYIYHGKGKITFYDKIYIEGEFINNILVSGMGIIPESNGSTYEGEINQINDKYHYYGQGKVTYPNGNYYEGRFINSILVDNGKGKIYMKDGRIYEGELIENNSSIILTGKGKMIYPDTSYFEGYFINERLTGLGKAKIFYPNKSVYEGEVIAVQIGNNNTILAHGKGKRININGDINKGNFINDKIIGKFSGKIIINNDKYYVGHLLGTPEKIFITGIGIMNVSNGYYTGNFIDGKLQGIGNGVLTLSDGTEYCGDVIEIDGIVSPN